MWYRIRNLLLAGLVAAASVGSAQAHGLLRHCCSSCDNACAPSCAAPCAPAAPAAPTTITVNCIEWVQETRQVPCTTYQWQQKTENYTCYKRETVQVQKPCTYTCKRYVTETVMENRTCVERIPHWEERTVMKAHWETQQVTEMRQKTVCNGHWETKEVPACSISLFGHKGCCDCAPKTKCVKCWVPCKETVCCPVTVCKKVKVCTPCTVKVCCYQTVCKQV